MLREIRVGGVVTFLVSIHHFALCLWFLAVCVSGGKGVIMRRISLKCQVLFQLEIPPNKIPKIVKFNFVSLKLLFYIALAYQCAQNACSEKNF